MEVIIQKDAEAASQLTAALIARALEVKPHLALGLATGRTMERLYSILAEKHHQERLDFSLAVTFNLDEYIGLPPEDPNSYRSYMNRHLFNRINIDRRNTFLPNGLAPDLDAECRLYEERIRDFGGIDLQLLGIGRVGHIGFNEPLSAMQSRTRCKALTPETVAENSRLFDDPAKMPKRAITMGVGTILECKRCLMLVTGKEKAAIVAKAVEGPITSMISASALQLHPRCTVIVDEDAASALQHGEYYRWIFENEEEWEHFRR
ncbi:MAG: glucosamine-6-phosphate deaminase [Candidatus Hydrogenedentes bacterium]|nr:glucosamine-6-phosphate deaminase [Candidatus Hydrogenedentota bacterium]MBI3118699.1 glucosamine-6-phosphate deaminase [Candidatus Hydrogenedentota bacterium]